MTIISTLILLGIVIVQWILYRVLITPIITTWGATKEEIAMSMAGDSASHTIISTRAITIQASKQNVWRWLMQLGADRCGFYSYGFIESALGYITRKQSVIQPEFLDFQPGDMVRGSIDESKSIKPYNFPVLYVKTDDELVLENWGTFLLKAISPAETRLVIRTQEPKAKNRWQMLASQITAALHYIMERCTLLGIKARAEIGSGKPLHSIGDIAWFIGIIFSGLLSYSLVYVGHNIAISAVTSLLAAVIWLYVLLVARPKALYSIMLFVLVAGLFVYIYSH